MAKTTAGATARKRDMPFTAPVPKGVRLNTGAIPKSGQYVPPNLAADPDEEAAFATLQDSGRPSRRGGRSALPPSAFGAAQQRMLGQRAVSVIGVGTDGETGGPDDGPDEDDGDTIDAEPPASERQPLRSAKAAAAAVPVPQPVPQHPLSPFGMTTAATVASAIVQSASVPDLQARIVVQEDTDRLWDWIRADKDYGQAFLGQRFSTSLALHTFMAQLIRVEAQGLAIIRAIHYGPHHLGFAMLAPILAAERTALLHVYLQAEVRAQLAQFIAPLVDMAQQIAPGVHLAVVSADAAWARLHRQILAPLGFTEHVMFIR